MCCASCGSANTLSIGLEGGSQPLDFHHCRACEHHWWVARGGDAMPLGRVLEVVGA